MDQKDHLEQFASSETDQENKSYDYKVLVRKLKSIKENITLLEKIFLDNTDINF